MYSFQGNCIQMIVVCYLKAMAVAAVLDGKSDSLLIWKFNTFLPLSESIVKNIRMFSNKLDKSAVIIN